MKGIPTQLQGIINFIDKSLQNRTISRTFECYLLNLEKAALDTLKVANIAFNNLDSFVPVDVRLLFQKTTNKIKQYIKHKPKGELQKQENYAQQYDEVQVYLENRPEIERTDEKERGELYKFLSQVQEKQKQNRLLLQNFPRYSYGATRIYSKQHRHFLSDIHPPLEFQCDTNQTCGSNFIQASSNKQTFQSQRKNYGVTAPKLNFQHQFVQTNLTAVQLDKLLKQCNSLFLPTIQSQQRLHTEPQQQKKGQIFCKKINNQQQNSTLQAVIRQQQQVNLTNFQDIQLALYQNKKKKSTMLSNKQSLHSQHLPQNYIHQKYKQTQNKHKEKLALMQKLELDKLEAKDKKSQFKNQTKGKMQQNKEIKNKKADPIRRDSTFKKTKNADQQSNRQKKVTDMKDAVDKPEKIAQKLSKTKTKQRGFGKRVSSNLSNLAESQFKTRSKQIQTQTENVNQIQRTLTKQTNAQLQLLKYDDYQYVQSLNKKTNSLHKINNLSEFYRNREKKINQFNKSKQGSNAELSQTKNIIEINQKDMLAKLQQEPVNKNLVYESKEEFVFPTLAQKNRSNKQYIHTANMQNFSLTNFREATESKIFKATKQNVQQFHQSMHMSKSKLQKYSNYSGQKKDYRKSQQILPTIRQDEENEQYKNRQKVLSKGKELHLDRQNKRLLEEIQQGTTQKKGKTVEWIKVIRDIREYEHLHFKYCGENCCHLQKFYDFLKKKNLSMYINRKQLYMHKQNIEMKPSLI